MEDTMEALLTGTGRLWPSLTLARCVSTSAPLSARGIRRTVKGLGLKEEELEEMEIEELEEMTYTSLQGVTQHAAQIDVDAKRFRAHLRHKTLEHKYFKPKGPREENLLTWSMKEQLKYLHATDPDQWTPETLSKSFPVSPEGVVRLLRTHWVPKSEAAREKHDRAVAARWRKHMKGQLGSFQILEKSLNKKFMPELLPTPVIGMDHLLTTLESLHFDGQQPHVAKGLKPKNRIPDPPKMKGVSFHSIIRDYKNQTSEGTRQEEQTDPGNTSSSSTPESAITSGPPQYEGPYTKVTMEHSDHRTVRRRNRSKNKIMTFAEFMKSNNT